MNYSGRNSGSSSSSSSASDSDSDDSSDDDFSASRKTKGMKGASTTNPFKLSPEATKAAYLVSPSLCIVF